MPRERTFDESAVLDAAVQVFWQKGYEAASINDLIESTGLNRGISCNQAPDAALTISQGPDSGCDRLCPGAYRPVASVSPASLQAVAAMFRTTSNPLISRDGEGGTEIAKGVKRREPYP